MEASLQKYKEIQQAKIKEEKRIQKEKEKKYEEKMNIKKMEEQEKAKKEKEISDYNRKKLEDYALKFAPSTKIFNHFVEMIENGEMDNFLLEYVANTGKKEITIFGKNSFFEIIKSVFDLGGVFDYTDNVLCGFNYAQFFLSPEFYSKSTEDDIKKDNLDDDKIIKYLTRGGRDYCRVLDCMMESINLHGGRTHVISKNENFKGMIITMQNSGFLYKRFIFEMRPLTFMEKYFLY